jgi:hypothetical protein
MGILAELLRGGDLGQTLDAARRVGRRRPGLVIIGLAIAAGFLLGRRLARAPSRAETPREVEPQSPVSPDLLVGVPPVPGGYGGMPLEE